MGPDVVGSCPESQVLGDTVVRGSGMFMLRKRTLWLVAGSWFACGGSFILGASPVADAFLVKWTDRRVAQIRPKPADKEFERIGWVSGLRHAFELGRDHQRPIFVFTYSGHIDQGRC